MLGLAQELPVGLQARRISALLKRGLETPLGACPSALPLSLCHTSTAQGVHGQAAVKGAAARRACDQLQLQVEPGLLACLPVLCQLGRPAGSQALGKPSLGAWGNPMVQLVSTAAEAHP